MTIHPNKFYCYAFEDSVFITKTHRDEHSYSCHATDILKLSGTADLLFDWAFENTVNMESSLISNVFEVSLETHPEYFI